MIVNHIIAIMLSPKHKHLILNLNTCCYFWTELIVLQTEIAGEGMEMEKENMGSHCFLKIYCPDDRLLLEAERLRLEMPLKGVNIRAVFTFIDVKIWENRLKR